MQAKLLADFLAPERNSFGTVRLAAALAVVLSHAFGLVSGNLLDDPVFRWTGFTLGQHAVHMFFVLSGLLVTASLMRASGIGTYIKSRGLRIFPGLIVCTLVCAFVLGPMASRLPLAEYVLQLETYKYIAMTLALVTGRAPLPEVFTTTPMGGIVNFSVWTLKYEVICYLALASAAFIGLLRSERRALASLVALFALILASYLWADLLAKDSVPDMARRFGLCFSLGAAAYFARSYLSVSRIGLATAVFLYALGFDTRLQDPATAVLTAYLVLVLASIRMGALSRFTEHTDLSFGVYLYGWPVGQMLLLAFPQLGVGALTALSLVVLLPVAWLSWTLIEAPALKLRSTAKHRLPSPSRQQRVLRVPSQRLRRKASEPVAARLRAITGKPVEDLPPPPPPMDPFLLQRVARIGGRGLPVERLRYRRVEIVAA